MTDTLTHNDLLNYELNEGDHVVYPTGSGSSKSMCVAEIIEIVDYTDTSWGRDRPHWKVRVQPKAWNDYRGSWGWITDEDGTQRYGKLDVPPRQVVIHNVHNLVKVQIPEEFKAASEPDTE